MLKKISSLLLSALLLTGIAASLTGCNTMEGAGKDMQQGGKAISDKANENK